MAAKKDNEKEEVKTDVKPDVKVHDTSSPEVKRDVPTPRQMIKGTNTQVTIEAISGKDVTVKGGKFEDGEKIRVANKAEVTLNDEPSCLADLDNGDVIVLGNGRKDTDNMNIFCYFKIDATRLDKKKK